MTRRIIACAIAIAFLGGAAFAQTGAFYYPHTGIIKMGDEKAFSDFVTPTDTHTTNGITFNLFYEDIRQSTGVGFDGGNGVAAQQRVKDTLDVVAASLNESGTLDILFEVSQTDGSGFLATAGSFYSATDGFVDPSSLTRINSGSKPAASFPEINVTVDFGFNYNFTSSATASGETDFMSVMLHELTHGLGFGTLSNSSGTSQFQSSFMTDTYTTYDSFIVKSQGGSNLWDSGGNFLGNTSDLTSQDLFFEGPSATTQYAQSGDQPGIYAPSTFASGSSLSHFDTGNIVGGAVMEHAIPVGTDRRTYAAVDIGALVDIGWGNASTGGGGGDPTIVSSSGSGAFEEGQTATLQFVFADETGLTLQWQKETSPGSGTYVDFPAVADPRVSGETTSTLAISNLVTTDAGRYRLEIDDGTKAITHSPPLSLGVFPAGSLPVSGVVGLILLGGALTVGGAYAVRRRNSA